MTNNPTHIVVHCSDSPRGRGDHAKNIHQWHLERGFDGIGYHYVINDEGFVETGRPWFWLGAHCPPYNNRSIGVCVIGFGKDDFSKAQIDGLTNLVKGLMRQFSIPKENVIGHYEADPDSGKTCPNYPMDEFRAIIP